MRVVLLVLGMLASVLAGCRPPGIGYVATEDIPGVRDAKTLMWAQADSSDPMFELAEDVEPANFTKDQLARLADMGLRLELSSKVLADLSEVDGFKGMAGQLGTKGTELRKAALAGDGASSAKLVLSVRETCRACHKAYR